MLARVTCLMKLGIVPIMDVTQQHRSVWFYLGMAGGIDLYSFLRSPTTCEAQCYKLEKLGVFDTLQILVKQFQILLKCIHVNQDNNTFSCFFL